MQQKKLLPTVPAVIGNGLSDYRITFKSSYKNDVAFYAPIDTLSVFSRRTHGILFYPDNEGSVSFITESGIPDDGYILDSEENGITIKAGGNSGFQNGVITLIQLLEKADDESFTFPLGRIVDNPDCSWRGIMIDLARDFHDFSMLLEYIDLCRFFKLHTIHLHFSDDGSYTLPSRAFPKLPNEGEHYTEEQIKELNDYAARRGIEIMPEIDLPGHSTHMRSVYPEIFGDHGIVCLGESSITAVDALFREVMGMFPNSRYMHIGGDEAAIWEWCNCEKCLAQFRGKVIDVDEKLKTEKGRTELSHYMYASFIKHASETVLSCGKTPVVWEGFCESMNDMIPKETVVICWECMYQLPPTILKSGFRVLNMSWAPMYIVTPIRQWPVEDVYNWNIYRFEGINEDSPYKNNPTYMEPTTQIEGGQLLAWGDCVISCHSTMKEGQLAEQHLMEERVPCLAENVWHKEKLSDFNELKKRYDRVMNLYSNFKANK